MKWLKFLTVDPVNLTVKSKVYALIACFCAIFFIALVTHIFALGPEYPMIVASMGASSVILFFIPNSPLAQPWPFAGGQILSALVGMTCALYINEIASAAATAVGGSVLIMLLFRCLHPPGAATSLAPIMAGPSLTAIGYEFVLQPVALNVIAMLILSIFINRWVFKLDYPTPLESKQSYSTSGQQSVNVNPAAVHSSDIKQALNELDIFVDMSPQNLSDILNKIEMHAFQRIKKDIHCRDIMITGLDTVEFGTYIEDAWKIMYQKKLKAIPVVDRHHRLLGIVTWHDFFKGLELTPYENFRDHFRQFIRRTTTLTSSKPEVVGQIMTPNVATLPDNAHIVELIPLMSERGYRQIPIVDPQQRLVGIVFPANLISALYHFTLSKE
jgi:CBS domain-containing membrane protein